MALESLRRPVFLLFLAVLSLSGCGSGDRILRVAVGPLGPTIDPTQTAELSSVIIGGGVYEGLLKQDAGGALLPHLAEAWAYDSTRTRLTVHLREGVLFHDGSELTARAASQILHDMLEDSRREGWNGVTPSLLGDPETIRATAPYAFEIVLDEPHAPLLRMLSTSTIVPIYKHAAAGTSEGGPIGTGPFRLASYSPGEGTAVLESFGDYWGRPPFAERVVFSAYPNASEGIDALERDDMDISTLFSMPDVNRVNSSPSMHLISSRPGTYICIGLNSQGVPFREAEARRAIGLAFDRQGVAASYYRAAALPTRSYAGRHLFPEVESPRAPLQDLEEARRLIERQPELRSRTLRLLVTPSSTPSREHWLNDPITDLFEGLGLSVRVEQTESYDEFVARVDEGDWEMSWDGLNSDTRDLYEFLHILYGSPSSQGGYGLFGVDDPTVPALIDSGRVQRDQEESRKYYRRALERIADYQPCVPFIDLKGFMARSSEVEPFPIQDAVTLDLGSIRKKGWR